MRWGQRRADRPPENQRQPLGVTKRQCWSVVGRLLDMFDKEASGVSALQHSARVRNPASAALQRERSEKWNG
jgi:hypothetical protein